MAEEKKRHSVAEQEPWQEMPAVAANRCSQC